MQTKARAKFIKISPKKVRLVADLIRGLDVEKANIQLQFTKKAASLPLAKLLKSAISNAEENLKLKKTNLFIKEIRIDEGPTLHRWMPKAMGRATPIRKRTSHLILVLDERIPTATKEIEKAKSEKVSKDDIIKIDDFDKIKADQKEEDKTEKGKKSTGKSTTKTFSKKLFNRRSGER
jgi:large subunit ribosomal protein L22